MAFIARQQQQQQCIQYVSSHDDGEDEDNSVSTAGSNA